MTYAYIKQNTQIISAAMQRETIQSWCSKKNTAVDFWIEGENGGTQLFDIVKDSDTVVVSDFARLGSSRQKVVEVLRFLLSSGVNVVSAKSGLYINCTEISAEIFLLIEKVVSEIDFSISSEVTKVGLAKAMEKGHKSGRRVGQRPGKVKLSGHEEEIRLGLQNGESILSLSKKFNVQWITMRDFIQKNL